MEVAPLADLMGQISPSFTYAHLDHSKETVAALRAIEGLKHLFVIRDLRNCLVSMMRFTDKRLALVNDTPHADTQDPSKFRDYLDKDGKSYVNSVKRQLGWMTMPEVSVFRFEAITTNQDDMIAKVISATGVAPEKAPEEIFTQSLGATTRTYSGTLSNWEMYWDDQVERIYEAIGARDVNAALGYGS